MGDEESGEHFRCGSSARKNIDFLEGVWSIIDLPGGELSDSTGSASLELHFAQNKCYGYVGCNRFYGTVQADEQGNISFDKLSIMHRACPKHSMESIYLETLGKARYYLLDRANGQMQLFDKEGKYLMRLEVLIAC